MILTKGATISIRCKKMGFIVSLSLFKFPFLIQCLPSTFNFQVHVWPLESISTVQTSQTNEHLGNSTKGNWSDNDWDRLCQSRLDLQILFWKHFALGYHSDVSRNIKYFWKLSRSKRLWSMLFNLSIINHFSQGGLRVWNSLGVEIGIWFWRNSSCFKL